MLSLSSDIFFLYLQETVERPSAKRNEDPKKKRHKKEKRRSRSRSKRRSLSSRRSRQRSKRRRRSLSSRRQRSRSRSRHHRHHDGDRSRSRHRQDSRQKSRSRRREKEKSGSKRKDTREDGGQVNDFIHKTFVPLIFCIMTVHWDPAADTSAPQRAGEGTTFPVSVQTRETNSFSRLPPVSRVREQGQG